MHSKGFAHLDLKHDNILLDENINVKLADFGFARKLPPDGLTSFGGCTPEYAPDEVLYIQTLKSPYNGFKSDIFSLGAIFYSALAI